ncbi:MAG: PQQ-dependent sugar dehydrogenase [Gemmatimonadaceae bacterium]
MTRSAVAGLGLAFTMLACGRSTPPEPLPDGLSVVPVVTGLTSPVFLTAPAGDSRLFIVEQPGRIRVVKNGTLLATPFLDIVARVGSGGERGLLGLAFHPQFATNGFFYVNFTDGDGHTRIERFHATPTSDVASATSATLVLGYDQPFSNHNGGMLLFGPDGMLWIGTGDGGSGGDPQDHGQRLNSLLGKMLRIDVAGTPYSVPPDNPYLGTAGARAEIWGTGLRNPWRYAFDRTNGLLYVADVGQNAWEEVHVVPGNPGGVNFGWRIMEGSHCRTAEPCDMTGLNIPVHEYSHADGCSITGGFVYRGNAIPGIRGHYFYSDFCAGFLRSFNLFGGIVVDQREWDVGALGFVTSFGEDASGELYILSTNGTVYRLAAT